MAKRSRDVSFSPPADDTSHPIPQGESPSDSETPPPPGKIKLIDVSPLPLQAIMQCSLPPHRSALAFTSIDGFEIHYAKEHAHRCSSCGNNFPTAHFLALHIDENHNVLREALEAKGEKTYACFVEGCDRKCSTPQKRRLHLIDKHMFPKDYNFRITDRGIDKTSSMLREGQRRRVSISDDQKESFGHRRRISRGNVVVESASTSQTNSTGKNKTIRGGLATPKTPKTPNPQGEPLERIAEAEYPLRTNGSAEVDELERSMSALKFIPYSVLRQQGKNKNAD